MFRARRFAAGVASCVILATAAVCHADTSAADRALAESLFREARELMAAGDLPKACEKFAESHRIDPALGTLLNAAVCHEKQGLFASAWAEYESAARMASRGGQRDRERFARGKADDLEKKLSRVVLEMPETTEQLVVSIDGRALGRAVWGTALPLDPGDHKLVVSGPGRKPHTMSLRVGQGPSTERVKIPMPEPDAAASVPSPAPTPSATVSAVPQPVASVVPQTEPLPVSAGPGSRKTWGYVLTGVGVAGLAVGTWAGLRVLSKQRIVEEECRGAGCNQTGYDADQAAHSTAVWADLGFGVGIVALAAGGWLLLGGSDGEPSKTALRATPTIGRGSAGLGLAGAF